MLKLLLGFPITMVGIIGIAQSIVGVGMTDKEKILNRLTAANHNYVCSSVFLREDFVKDYAQRISDLRKKGYKISGTKCEIEGHSHKMNMYKLLEDDVTLLVDAIFGADYGDSVR
jgi:hypothetical protein